MKILVCVDGSPQSRRAVDQAVELAAGCRVDHVTLINVFEKYPLYSIEEGSREHIQAEIKHNELMNAKMVEEHGNWLHEAAGRFQEKGIEPEILMKEGHAAHTIAETADQEGYDMIIMGCRGRGGLKKLLLGSVSNAVIQQTKVNVLIVK